jgi:arylsulfatase
MTKPFKGVVNLDIRDSTPDWEPFMQPQAPEGAPNVLMIVWDDVGYGAMDVFGGPIETPTMRRLADAGSATRTSTRRRSARRRARAS